MRLILRRRKKKKSIKIQIETKKAKFLRYKYEEKALYLLQLWADTFMMEQDSYRDFHSNYRELRAEGI